MRLCGAESISQISLDLMFLNAVEIRFPNRHDLLAQLETTQNLDFVERDRSIMRKQLSIIEDELYAAKNASDELQGQIEVLKMRHELFGECFDEAEIAEKMQEQGTLISQLEAEKTAMETALDKKEKHWASLEKDYAIREELIYLMKTSDMDIVRLSLPRYVKALALSITVHDKTHFTVRWFDGTETEIT